MPHVYYLGAYPVAPLQPGEHADFQVRATVHLTAGQSNHTERIQKPALGFSKWRQHLDLRFEMCFTPSTKFSEKPC